MTSHGVLICTFPKLLLWSRERRRGLSSPSGPGNTFVVFARWGSFKCKTSTWHWKPLVSLLISYDWTTWDRNPAWMPVQPDSARAMAAGGIPHLEMPSRRVSVFLVAFLQFCHYFPYKFEHQSSSGTCSGLKEQNNKMMAATSVESGGWNRLSALVNVLLQENLQVLDVGLEKSSEASVRESSLLVSAEKQSFAIWRPLRKWARAKQTVWLLCS